MSCLFLPMKKQPLVKKLHKPAHPMAGKAVLGVGILLALGALVFVFQQQSVSSTPISQNTPTPTSILAQMSPSASPTLISTINWATYHNWKYNYAIKLPPEFKPFEVGLKPDDVINLSERNYTNFTENSLSPTIRYGFIVRVGNLLHNGTNNTPVSCSADLACYEQIYKSVSVGHSTFPIYSTLVNRQIKGIGFYNESSKEYYYEYPISVNGNYFGVEFNFKQGLTPEEIRTKQPLIDTILSTVSVGN
jgi:hypothetical protein